METLPTILIVDDVAMFRDLGRLFLARSGRVLTAESGAEALEVARRERPAVVVTDLHMPDLDGAAVCRAVKAEPALPDTRVIIMAGDGAPEDHARAVRAGADDVLTKPLSRVTFIAAVNRFVRCAGMRGLPRVRVDLPVDIAVDREQTAGTIHNVSRGGAFIEPRQPLGLEPRMEVDLCFELPADRVPIAPRAQLVWERRAPNGGPRGMGFRFLGLDSETTRRLEEYVMDQGIATSERPTAAAVVNS